MYQNSINETQVTPETWANYVSWTKDFGYVLPEDCRLDDGTTEDIPQEPTEDIPPTTEDIPPTTEDIPPTTEDIPPTTEDIPPTTEDIPQALTQQLEKARNGSATAVNPIVWATTVEQFSSAVSFGTGGPTTQYAPIFGEEFVQTRRPFSMTINGTTHVLSMGMCIYKGGQTVYNDWYGEATTYGRALKEIGWGTVKVHHHMTNELEGTWTTRDFKNYMTHHDKLDRIMHDMRMWEERWERKMTIILNDEFKPKPRIVTMSVDGKIIKTWAVPEDYNVRVSFGMGNNEENITTMALTDEEEGVTLV